MAYATAQYNFAGSVAVVTGGASGIGAEVAEMVAWLCSGSCTFNTGAVFDLSGGRATY
jgi:hypothetical protein